MKVKKKKDSLIINLRDLERGISPINKVIAGNVLDVLKAFPDNFVDTIVTSPPYWCYTKKHEVLTWDGWKDIKEVKKGDLVLSVNPGSRELEWVKVVRTGRWKYRGKVVQFKNTHIDLQVTPDHNMLVYYRNVGDPIKEKNRDCRGRYTKSLNKGFFVKAKEIKLGHVTPKTGFSWRGNNVKYFVLPKLKVLYNKQSRLFPAKKIKMKDWVAFLGLWIAEGSVRGSKGGKKKTYTVSLKQKPPEDKKVRRLLKRLPFEFRETKSRNGIVCFYLPDRQLWNYLKQLGNSYTKYIPKEIKELSSSLLRTFIKWYLFGDGCVKNRRRTARERNTGFLNVNKGYVSCYTASSRLKDDLTEVALKIGSNVSVRGENILTFLKRKTIKLKKTMTLQDYKGFIYGIEVEKNHTLCIRRNNKVVFSGNSLRDYGRKTDTVWGGDKNCEHEWEELETVVRTGSSNKSTLRHGRPRKKTEKYVEQVKKIRSGFCRKCGAWLGQLGLEPSLEMYLDHLLQIIAELKRVLKPSGIMFWNHGDCYGGKSSRASFGGRAGFGTPRECVDKRDDIPVKCMVMQNYRLILRMLEDLRKWELRDDLTQKEKEYVIKELIKAGVLE